MRFNVLLATLFYFISQMSLVQAFHGEGSRCPCIGVSTTRIQKALITNYTLCRTGIVVFYTKENSRICSDPKSKWAKMVMKKVDLETEDLLETGENEQGSASDVTTTVSTTQKKTPDMKGRRQRRWLQLHP